MKIRLVIGSAGVVIGLNRGFETIKSEVPEAIEKCSQLVEAVRTQAIQSFRPFSSFGHEPDLDEDANVLRNRGARRLEAAGDFTRSQLARSDQPQNRDTSWRGERTQ